MGTTKSEIDFVRFICLLSNLCTSRLRIDRWRLAETSTISWAGLSLLRLCQSLKFIVLPSSSSSSITTTPTSCLFVCLFFSAKSILFRLDLVLLLPSMSAASGNLANRMNSASNVDDLSMFQAMRQVGRRNAMADLGEQLAQGSLVELILTSFSLCLSFLTFSECCNHRCGNG